MIINCRVFTLKHGEEQEAVDILKSGASHMQEIPSFRICTSSLGPGGRVVLELEFHDLAHYERWWAAWSAEPQTAQVLERWRATVEPGWEERDLADSLSVWPLPRHIIPIFTPERKNSMPVFLYQASYTAKPGLR